MRVVRRKRIGHGWFVVWGIDLLIILWFVLMCIPSTSELIWNAIYSVWK